MATGTAHTVRDFLGFAFEHVGLDWQRDVRFDDRYVRPSEVDALVGNPFRADQILGWRPRVLTPDLARIMVDAEGSAADGGGAGEPPLQPHRLTLPGRRAATAVEAS